MNQRNNPNQSDRKLLTVSDRDIFVTTQKALLVGIILKNEIRADKEESLKELINLVKTAGSNPTIIQTKRVERVDPKTYIGKGSIAELVDISDANDIDVVIFDCELTPNQQKELRALFKCDVVDRTGLILDIFALHAQSKEATLQVELALSIYLKPRLAGLGKTLNQQGGGIGTRGPGETKLETDNRLIDNRINKLKKDKNAVILAHNYQTPEIYHGVADISADSLALAVEASKTKADKIIMCGVHFMAETAKLMCPEKKVFLPDMQAGCSCLLYTSPSPRD